VACPHTRRVIRGKKRGKKPEQAVLGSPGIARINTFAGFGLLGYAPGTHAPMKRFSVLLKISEPCG
jgi:hypothetical protein